MSTLPTGLDALIEALTILRRYGNVEYSTHCEHDELTICVDPAKVSAADKARLDELGVFETNTHGYPCFKSFVFGSA